MWIDSHAHLHDRVFRDDVEDVLRRAAENAVSTLILIGSSERESANALALCKRYGSDGASTGCASERGEHSAPQADRLTTSASPMPKLFCTLGVHPHDASSWTEKTADVFRDVCRRQPRIPANGARAAHAAGAASEEKAAEQTVGARERVQYGCIVALGEFGLDYYRDLSPRDVQRRVFRRQLELAYELCLPLVLHAREATSDFLEILEEAHADGLLFDDAGVCHCFSGSVETAERLIELGFSLGFDGPITFKNARRAHDVIQSVPTDRLLVETDCPYLTPEPYRGQRNEPAHIPLIGRKMAELLGLSEEETARITTENTKRLFGLNG